MSRFGLFGGGCVGRQRQTAWTSPASMDPFLNRHQSYVVTSLTSRLEFRGDRGGLVGRRVGTWVTGEISTGEYITVSTMHPWRDKTHLYTWEKKERERVSSPFTFPFCGLGKLWNANQEQNKCVSLYWSVLVVLWPLLSLLWWGHRRGQHTYSNGQGLKGSLNNFLCS